MRIRPLYIIVVALSLVHVRAFAQTSVNPDISVIPRFRIETTDAAAASGSRAFSTPTMGMDEVEFAIQGYVNPFARADLFMAKPGGEEGLEIEEATVTVLRGLPFDLNIKAGKFLLEFGKHNTQHPHAWPFLSRPLSHERFLGEEGANSAGVAVSTLLPTGDIYSRWNMEVFDAGTLLSIDPTSGSVAGGVGMADTLGGAPRLGFSSRLTAFVPVGESNDLEVGLSGMTGVHDPYAGHRFWYGNVEMKYQWKPDAYNSWKVQAEAIVNARTVTGAVADERVRSFGGFVLADRQFAKVYSAGARLDWSEAPYASADRAWGGAFWLGFYPVEETLALRLQWQHVVAESPSAPRTRWNTVALEVLFSLGPHRAHAF